MSFDLWWNWEGSNLVNAAVWSSTNGRAFFPMKTSRCYGAGKAEIAKNAKMFSNKNVCFFRKTSPFWPAFCVYRLGTYEFHFCLKVRVENSSSKMNHVFFNGGWLQGFVETPKIREDLLFCLWRTRGSSFCKVPTAKYSRNCGWRVSIIHSTLLGCGGFPGFNPIWKIFVKMDIFPK